VGVTLSGSHIGTLSPPSSLGIATRLDIQSVRMGGAGSYEAGRDEDTKRAQKLLETREEVELPDAKTSATLPDLVADILAKNEKLAGTAPHSHAPSPVTSPETDHPDIFVSYAARRRNTVLPIKDALVEKGYTVFFDFESLSAGDEFADIIDSRLKRAGVVVACWSHESFKSRWCKSEWRVGLNKNILLPLAIDEITFDEIPTEFNGVHYIDFTQFSGAMGDPCFKELLRAIQRHLKA
jgi:hypothetical protein